MALWKNNHQAEMLRLPGGGSGGLMFTFLVGQLMKTDDQGGGKDLRQQPSGYILFMRRRDRRQSFFSPEVCLVERDGGVPFPCELLTSFDETCMGS